MKRKTKRIGYTAIVLWIIWPLIPSLLASVAAHACGCVLDEGSVHPCVVFGKDIGELLYTMGVMGLICIGTFPSGLIALVVFKLFAWWHDRTYGAV